MVDPFYEIKDEFFGYMGDIVYGLCGCAGVLLVLAGPFSSLVLLGSIEDQLALRLQVGLGLAVH